MAATAAKPTDTMEPLKELAAPVNDGMGEPVGIGMELEGIDISECSITCERGGLMLAYPVPEGAPLPVGNGTPLVDAMGRTLLEPMMGRTLLEPTMGMTLLDPTMGMTLLDSTRTALLEAIGMTLELTAGPLGTAPPTVMVE